MQSVYLLSSYSHWQRKHTTVDMPRWKLLF